jgi:hypothetical protein
MNSIIKLLFFIFLDKSIAKYVAPFNTQININSNGKTTLATAGKYCDRNIDVNVDVAGKPTPFTNLYNPANVVLKTVSNCSSSNGVTFTTDNYVNYIVIPYHHKAGEPVVLRVRGLSIPVRDRQNFTVFNEDGTTQITWGQLSSAVTSTYDEYGDAVMTFKHSTTTNKEWYYLHLNFQYVGNNSGVTTPREGCIITINEPIGNGGHVG